MNSKNKTTSATATKIQRPVAPPVYRPQPVPRVLQTKSSLVRSQPASQTPRKPVAPPVYRPQAKKVVQPKSNAPQRNLPTAPPVYRPEQKRVVQPKAIMRNTRIIQRMEDKKKTEESGIYKLGSLVAPKISRIFHLPNIFEMVQFTSCVCLVFNRAGMSIEQVQEISGDYRKTFEDVKQKWDLGGKGRPFIAMCPYNSEGSVSLEFSKFCGQCMMDENILGPNPLIAVIGHSAAGSDSIRGDKETGLSFSVGQVFDVIRPLMKRNCTIFLSPCNTAIGNEGSQSFQDRLISTVEDTDPEAFVIGTNSRSLPIGGEVLTTGYTVKHTKTGEMPLEDFTIRPIVNCEPKKIKRSKKVRVITEIPTYEQAKEGKTEKYVWKKRK